MPAAKRKSGEANLENQLPPITGLLQVNPVNDAKRAKTLNQNAPLGDISNSPWPIKWTAFGTGKYVEDPLRPVAPIQLPVPEENQEEVEEVEQLVVPVEAPAKKVATAKKTAAKKNTAEPAPEAESVEPVTEDAAAPAKKTRKPAAKKGTPKEASKPADVTPVELAVAPEVPAAKTAAPSGKAKKPAAKKAAPKAKNAAPVEAVPVSEEPIVEAVADTAMAKKPAAKKATSKAKAKTAEVAEPAPTGPTVTAKKPTKSKAKSKAAEEPTPVVEPEAPAPAPTKKTTTKAPKAPKEPAPKPTKAAKNALPEFITTVYLDGQDDDTVPVFDTCDVVRRKITGALTSATHTKASLLRAFAACTSEPDHALAPNSFQRFMAAKGKTGGCSNRTFYAGYVYFEKQRIAEKKKKTKTREEMEAAWGSNGMDYENLGKPMLVMAGESISTDQYGRQVLTSGGRSKVLM
ncbi:hypothetical protein TWF281_002901 [Arthrobotrys megalospora]